MVYNNIIYNNLIFFLGLYSWNFKPNSKLQSYINKKNINNFNYTKNKNYLSLFSSSGNKNGNGNINTNGQFNNKQLIEYNQTDSNSPSLNLYIDSINLLPLNLKKKIIVYLYNFYFLCILLFLCIQPLYTICIIFTKEDKEDLLEFHISKFLINVNIPISFIWAKYYFTTNHFDIISNTMDCGYIFIILMLITFISIVTNIFYIDHFYNEYYFMNYFNVYIANIVLIIEWIYSRLIFALCSVCFTIVFCKHINDISEFINKLIKNEYDFEDNYCLNFLIITISQLRNNIELSISFFNILLSFITITGGLSLGIYIKKKHSLYILSKELNVIKEIDSQSLSENITELKDDLLNDNVAVINNVTYMANNYFIISNDMDYYLILSFIFYIICQGVFFWNIVQFSKLRNRLVKLIQSTYFVNRFLTRWSKSKIKKKCKDASETKHYIKMLITLQEENATSIDWILINKLVVDKWMDFSILGISTQDGSLIKKVITFSSIIYFVIGYF